MPRRFVPRLPAPLRLAFASFCCSCLGHFLAAPWNGPAHAADDGYQPVTGQPVESIAASPFIAGAYGFIWVALLVYVVSLARELRKARAELTDLRRKLEQG